MGVGVHFTIPFELHSQTRFAQSIDIPVYEHEELFLKNSILIIILGEQTYKYIYSNTLKIKYRKNILKIMRIKTGSKTVTI